MNLQDYIREIPDFPRKGILFKDITTLLRDKDIFKKVIKLMTQRYKNQVIDQVVAIESRGFIFGGAIAQTLHCGLVLARKQGKLPGEKIKENYTLEYGKNTLEMHRDSINKGDKVLIIDDLLATGGTALAVARMVERLGGIIKGLDFLIELSFLSGREKLHKYGVTSYIKY